MQRPTPIASGDILPVFSTVYARYTQDRVRTVLHQTGERILATIRHMIEPDQQRGRVSGQD